ncbi:hypothetical protein BpHYR1_036888, partial [Brachionus plicatilis]
MILKEILSIVIFLFEIKNFTACWNLSTKILNDIFINIDPKIDRAGKVAVVPAPNRTVKSKYDFKIDLIERRLDAVVSSTRLIKQVKNRDIKIYYKTKAHMGSKTSSNGSSSILKLDNFDLNKLVQFNYLMESDQSFYLIKINRDFL